MFTRILSTIRGLAGNEAGGSAIEYSAIIALIAVAMIVGLQSIGVRLQAVLTLATNAMI